MKQKIEQRFKLNEQALDAMRRIQEPPRKLLFPWHLQRRQIYEHLKRILRQAGLPNDSKHLFHCLRRTCASFIAKEAGAEMAARQLGHSSSTVTKRYIDPSIARSHIDGAMYLPELNFDGDNH